MTKDLQKAGEDVVKMLCQIYDPEIPVNIYELGLIYDVQVSEEYDVQILMTFTAANCPVAESLPIEIKESMIPTYVVYYKECYNREKMLFREFFNEIVIIINDIKKIIILKILLKFVSISLLFL